MFCETGALGSWPQIMVIFAVGVAIGWLRPGLEAVRRRRHLNEILKSAEQLGRRDRYVGPRRPRQFDDRNHYHLRR